jgi:hypothetical protein
MKRWFAIVAVGMVLLYAALALGAAGCAFMPKAEPAHAHHAPSHAGHSGLCAWACQVNSMNSLQAAAPVLAGLLLVMMQRVVRALSPARLLTRVSRSRAPPSLITI